MSEQDFLAGYDSLSDSLFRYCYFWVADRELAKDLVQEAFVHTWEHIARGNKILNLRAFLYRVAHNLMVDEIRRRKPLSLEEMSEKGFEPALANAKEMMEREADTKQILRYFDRLHPKMREVVVLRYVDGMGPKEIAKIVGASENNVSVRLHRAVAELRSMFLNAA